MRGLTVIAAALGTLLLAMGCEDGGTALAPEPNYDGGGRAVLKIMAAPSSPFGRIAARASLTISADDMITMTRALTVTDSSVEGTITGIPAGPSRLFEVAVYDSMDTVRYRGTGTADVLADTTVEVSITVIRVSGGAVINGTISEGDTVPSAGLIAYYPFNGNADDESGNGHHGAVFGPLTCPDRFGVTQSAFMFNGTTDSISVPFSEDLLPASISVSCWFYQDNHPSGGWISVIMSNGCVDVAPAWEIGTRMQLPDFAGESVQFCYRGTGAVRTILRDSVEDNGLGEWHHVLATYDSVSARMQLYRDGVLLREETGVRAGRITSSRSFLIGAVTGCAGNHKAFDGALDDIRIYNRALSAHEVSLLYHEGGWTPGAKPHLLITRRYVGSSNSAIFRMAPDGTGEVMLTDSNGSNTDGRYSPDKSAIVYSSDASSNGKPQIFIMHSDGTGKQQLTSESTGAWGPQIVGSKIWFVATAGAWDQRIYTMNLDGSGITQVSTQTGQHNYFKVVDTAVYYVRSTAGDVNGSAIYRSPLDFATNTLISSIEYCMFNDAAPDGATCTRSRLDNTGSAALPQNIHVLHTDGSGERQLSQFTGETACDFSRYSPDGSRIAYAVWNPDESDIYVIGLDGTNNRRITNTTGVNEWPTDWR